MNTWQIKSYHDYLSAYRAAQEEPENFWGKIAETFRWQQKWERVQRSNLKTGDISWFTGAKLNITENCLDRHVASKPDHTALIFEPADPAEQHSKISYTYAELLAEVCRVANLLKKLGIEKGDRVCIYMPMIPELLFAVLGCARIGAVHSVVFGGFSAESLATRIQDTQCKLVVTADFASRGEKKVFLKQTVIDAFKHLKAHSLQHSAKQLLVLNRATLTGNSPSGTEQSHSQTRSRALELKEVDWQTAITDIANTCAPEICDSEDPLFILYTSGSTGSPKGILHTTAGYMIWSAYTFANVFQTDHSSIHWCTADIGWITGHSYIAYGPLLTGTTTVMFEGTPTWPNPGRLWEVIAKHKVTHFYTAPTVIRSLQAFPDSHVLQSDRSSLRVLGSVGEPINASAWQWYHDIVGEKRCPVVDTWWQTETGGIMISALAGITPLRPTYAGLPLPGVLPVVLDDEGNTLAETCAAGNLCIKQSWPGMMRSVYRNHDRFLNGYLKPFAGHYFTGDGAIRDIDGYYRITGRVDDVLNVSGHRLGTAEIENAINKAEQVTESAVIGVPDQVTGEAIFAFVVLNSSQSQEAIESAVRSEVTQHIGALAKPKYVLPVPGLPKTRSGKIMRRLLRRIAEGEATDLGDTSTLMNPEIVDEILKAFLQSKTVH